MATRPELEKKFVFRFAKVTGIVLAVIVLGLTLLIWYATKETIRNIDQAYFVCNFSSTSHQLTSGEKEILRVLGLNTFARGSEENTRLSKECYKEYSGGKDPEMATQSDIAMFREFTDGADERTYTIQGIKQEEDWHWGYLMLALLIEYGIFVGLRNTGLYVAGGKEALE